MFNNLGAFLDVWEASRFKILSFWLISTLFNTNVTSFKETLKFNVSTSLRFIKRNEISFLYEE